jgi:arabinogalactan oligomer/maltooligosaccharide transport system permease protein
MTSGSSTRNDRLRFAIGLVLAGALGCWLTHRFAGEAVRAEAAEAESRRSVVALEALTTLVARTPDDALGRAVADWQARTRGVAQARVLTIAGARLAASTAPADTGERAAPRRLVRDEKPFYDRGQRIASAVRGNREEESARKPEIEVAPAEQPGRLSLAGPLEQGGEVVGMVEIETLSAPPPPEEPLLHYLVALLAPLAVFGAGALVVRPKRQALAALAAVCLGAALLLLTLSRAQRVETARRAGAQAVAEQAALVGGADPAALDVDAFRRPRADRLAAAARDRDVALRRSLLAADGLALLALLFVGLGGANRLGATLRRNRRAYLYIAPAILGTLVLVFFPFFYGIALSFTDSNLYNTSQPISEIWIGLKNYGAILGDFNFVARTETGSVINYQNFYYTLGFTIVWTVTNVSIGVTSGLVLALILNTKRLALRPLYRVLLIMPWAMPNYITALIWQGMFHRQFGVINQVLQMFGVAPLSWFDHPVTSFLTALATNAWLSFPFMMVVSLGALQSIPADIYEAARVDGATRWQQFRAITLPSLKPALVPAIVLSVVWTFNMFNIIYLVTAGEPGGSTEILVTQAYKFAFQRYRYGYAAAYSTVIFVILLIYGAIQNRVSRATEA